MKKFFSLLVMIFSIFLGFSAAQNVEQISVGFCNEGTGENTGNVSSRYTLSINPGEERSLCISAQNNSAQDLKISYSFPLGNLTDWGTQTCGVGNDFEKFIVGKSDKIIYLSGNSTKIVHEKILVPLGLSGMFYGCLVYNVEGSSTGAAAGDSMFKIIVRKASFLNLFVGGDAVVRKSISLGDLTGGVFSTNAKVKAEVADDNTVTLSFLLQNNGNVVQNVALSGMIYNFLGFQKPFDAGTKKLMPGESTLVSINAGILPSYKGLYDVRVSLQGTPFFDFDASALSPETLTSTTIVETAKFIVFSWIWVVVVVIVLGIVVKVVLPRKRKSAEVIAA